MDVLAFVPVVALPLVVILVALINAGGILLVYKYTDAFFDAIEKYVPFIGSRLAGKGRQVSTRVANYIRGWNRESWQQLPKWLQALREAGEEMDIAAVQLAVAVRSRFRSLSERLWDPVTGLQARHAARLDAQANRIGKIEATDPAQIRADLAALAARLYTPGSGDVKVIELRLDGHHVRLREIETERLPEHTARLDTHHTRLRVIETEWIPEHRTRLDTHHVRIREIETIRLPAVEQTTSRHESQLGGLAPIGAAITAAIPLVALTPTLITLAQNEPKLRRFCSMDVDKFDDYLGFASPLPTLGGIRDTVRGAAGLAGELATLLRVPLGR